MKFRKFEIISVIESPGGAGPERLWKVNYKAIVEKNWKVGFLNVLARNAQEAKEKAYNRFGGQN